MAARRDSIHRRAAARALVAALAALTIIAGCSSPPPPPAPTVVKIALSAAPNVNPSREGRPSPIVVQIYQLKTTAKFDEADFFQLTGNAAATLGPTLAATEQVVLTPGETATLTRTMNPEALIVGVTASFRDIDNATWRASASVDEHKTTTLRATLGERAVLLTRAAP